LPPLGVEGLNPASVRMTRRFSYQALGLLAAFVAGAVLATSAPLAWAQDAQVEADARLNALGSSLAFTCFSSCGYVGALADGFEAGTYEAEYLRVRLIGLRNGLKGNVEQLKAMRAQVPMTPADHKSLTAFREIIEGINAQASALLAFLKSKDAAQAGLFRAKRKATWRKLSDALGLGDSAALFAPGGEGFGADARPAGKKDGKDEKDEKDEKDGKKD
jgi:hypothetical protein